LILINIVLVVVLVVVLVLVLEIEGTHTTSRTTTSTRTNPMTNSIGIPQFVMDPKILRSPLASPSPLVWVSFRDPAQNDYCWEPVKVLA
jgi:hypothetical protein